MSSITIKLSDIGQSTGDSAHLIRQLVLRALTEHNVTDSLDEIFGSMHAYPDSVPQNLWPMLLSPLRARTPDGMSAFDKLLERYPRPIDKLFLSLFARILWEGVMCYDDRIPDWAQRTRKREAIWEETAWCAFGRAWEDAGFESNGLEMDYFYPGLGWAVWAMKQAGVFGEDCVE
ncbi:hypothetical protein FRC08_001873 [Ceratobasidium sp. 394]|nr:hypothetical protein FRC08_001873 [Ceratobasidium sp. 394]KAG9073947.1 hypothetical protein FS749_014539 [Ceratobasidium sp. UAMH 11750]